MQLKNEFLQLKKIADFAEMMVKIKKDVIHAFIYKLLVALILPVATANVEIVFSVMNIVKVGYTIA